MARDSTPACYGSRPRCANSVTATSPTVVEAGRASAPEVPQHGLQDPAVAEVGHLVRRVEADGRLELGQTALVAASRNIHGPRLAVLEVADVVALLACEAEALGALA